MLCAVILEALRMRHTPNVLCKLCMTGITTALLQVQLLAAQARRSLHFPQLDSLLHELDELGSLLHPHRSFFKSSLISHVVRSSCTSVRRSLVVYFCSTFTRRIHPFDIHSSYTSARRSLIVLFRSSFDVVRTTYAHGHHGHGQPRPVGTSTVTRYILFTN